MHWRVHDSATDAPWAVLIHGLGASGGYLTRLAKTLAEHYRVAVPDLPGHGRSRRDRPLGVSELAGALARWLDVAHISAPLLIGHSIGCPVAVHVAAQRTDVCGLVLLSPAIDQGVGGWGHQVSRLLRDAPREPPSLLTSLAGDYVRSGLRQPLTAARSTMTDDIEMMSRQVGAPTLLVRGTRDVVVTRRWTQRMSERMRDARRVEVVGAAHGLPYSAPAPIARAIREDPRFPVCGGCRARE